MLPELVVRVVRRKFRVRVSGDCMPVACRNSDRNMLADLWGALDYRRGVEIGVMRAEFSVEILQRVPQCHLTCIDPWSTYDLSHRTVTSQNQNYKYAQQRLTPYVEQGRATILKMTSMDALAEVDDGLDFVFVDGDHTFDHAVMDIICWSRKLKSGGMMAVHDYNPMRHSGVMKAVEAYTYCHNIQPWFVTREWKYPTAFWVKP